MLNEKLSEVGVGKLFFFFLNSQVVNIVGFMGHIVFMATVQLSCCAAAARDDTYTNEAACDSVKLCGHKKE